MANTLDLFNLLTRHQVYLEGVKAGEANDFNYVLVELDKEIRRLFAHLEYDELDQLTKRELREFTNDLKYAQTDIYSRYIAKILGDINEFTSVDIDVTRDIYEETQGITPEEAESDAFSIPLFGRAGFTGTAEGDAIAFGKVTNAGIPATGTLLAVMLAEFGETSQQLVNETVVRGYLDKMTKAQVLRAIRGTKSKRYSDGDFATINRRNRAVINTAYQQADSIVQAGIGSIYYRKYQWVSVIDGRTTDICLGRAGKIYTFGNGPLPPAHIGCRSKIVPLDKRNDALDMTYYKWIKMQPNTVQNDILGAKTAQKLRSGELNSKDFPKFAGAKPISIEQFSAKRSLIKTK